MNIESFKELMDGFDPAALLPDLSTVLGRVELIARIAVVLGPIVLLVLGLAYLFLSPREANHYFGYRCYFGMGSVEAWRFSQRLAGMAWTALGLVLTVVMVIISTGFKGKEAMDMATSAVWCLVWQVALVAVSVLIINFVVMLRFDRNGDYRTDAPREKAPREKIVRERPAREKPAGEKKPFKLDLFKKKEEAPVTETPEDIIAQFRADEILEEIAQEAVQEEPLQEEIIETEELPQEMTEEIPAMEEIQEEMTEELPEAPVTE